MDATANNIVKGSIGTLAPLFGAAGSLLFHIEAWLRIGSLILGIAVGIVTFISFIRDLRK